MSWGVGREADEAVGIDGHREHAEEEAVRGAVHAIAEAAAAVVDGEVNSVARVEGLVRATGAVRLQDGVDEGAVTRLAGAHPAVRRSDGHPAPG